MYIFRNSFSKLSCHEMNYLLDNQIWSDSLVSDFHRLFQIILSEKIGWIHSSI